MRMNVGLAIAIATVLITGAAFGQDDPIAARQALMKRNGQESKVVFDMIRGTTPFDAAAAADAMNALSADMAVLPTLFPPGSDQGETKASPEIFTNMDQFKALAARLGTDAQAAANAAANGVDALKVAFDAVGADCGACHQQFRMR
jgi:cytochrome c556